MRNLQDNFKHSDIRITGVPEGELPNLAKEIDFQGVQEAQRPKEVGPKEAHTKAHHNYTTQD